MVVLGLLADIARVAGGGAHSGLAAQLFVAAGGALMAASFLSVRHASNRFSILLRGTALSATLVLVVSAGLNTVFDSPYPPWFNLPRGLLAGAALLALGAAIPFLVHPKLPGLGGVVAGRFATTHVIALLLLLATLLGADYLGRPNLWRSPEFYLLAAVVYPGALAFATTRATGRWGATITAAWYMAMAWAAPTTLVWASSGADAALVPPPILVVLAVPAIAVDATVRVTGTQWGRALIGGTGFLVLFLALHWLAAPTALEASTAAIYPPLAEWPVGHVPDWPDRFWLVYPGMRTTGAGLMASAACAVASAYVGFLAVTASPD